VPGGVGRNGSKRKGVLIRLRAGWQKERIKGEEIDLKFDGEAIALVKKEGGGFFGGGQNGERENKQTGAGRGQLKVKQASQFRCFGGR